MVAMAKGIVARRVFPAHPEVKKVLLGGIGWTDGCFVGTVGRFGDEGTISRYVQEQGLGDYQKLHESDQLLLF